MEVVGPGLDRAIETAQPGQQLEPRPAGDDAAGDQGVGDGGERRAGQDDDPLGLSTSRLC
jgi:hypothetical protein